MKLHLRGSTGMFTALALLAQGARAQSGATAGGIQPSKAMIVFRDSAGSRFISSPQIDSLAKRLNVLPVGSAEFFATQAALEAAIKALPRPGGATGTFQIDIAAPRAAMKMPIDVVPQGTLGFTSYGVNRTFYNPAGNYLQYFEYPTVVAIEANSPAARAGVRTGDLLVAYDGLDVSKNPINMTQLLVPGRDVMVKLRRDGDMRDVQMTVEKAPADLIAERRRDAFGVSVEQRRLVEGQAVVAARGTSPSTATPKAPVATGGFAGGSYQDVRIAAVTRAPSANGLLGAEMTEVDPGLAAAIRGMEGKHGVLLTRVPEGSFADRIGLRNGDVIQKVESVQVSTVREVSLRLLMADQSGSEKVKLTVMRSGKTKEISYNPR